MLGIFKDNYFKIDNTNAITLIIPEGRKQDMNSKTRDKGYDINCLCYMLNELSREIHNNPDITDFKMNITNKDLAKIMGYDVINAKQHRLYGIKETKDLLFTRVKNVLVYDAITGNMASIPIFKYILWETDAQEIYIEFNPRFIEYVKDCKELTDVEGYTRLYLDICVSLSTLNSKIIWAILCRYNSQLDYAGHTDMKAITLLNYISPYTIEGKKKIYTMRFNDLETTVNRAIKEINTLLVEKALLQNKTPIGYEVEWEWSITNGATSKRGKLLSVSFTKTELDANDFIEEPKQDIVTTKTKYSGANKKTKKSTKDSKPKESKKEQTTKKRHNYFGDME